jgi:glucose-1-phosphate adenylyltransferase
MSVDECNRITHFHEKPDTPCPLFDKPGFTLASMGNYVFDTEFLIELLLADALDLHSEHDFGKDIIPASIANSQVYASRFNDCENNVQLYWKDVGTLDSFWRANMDLIAVTPQLNLYDKDWPILTHQEQSKPAKLTLKDDHSGYVVDSTIFCGFGCDVTGAEISKSLVFSNVQIHSCSKVDESVILPKVEIGKNVIIKRAIIDSGCKITDGMCIGLDNEQDASRGFRISKDGIVLVTKDMLLQKELPLTYLEIKQPLSMPA